MILVECPICHTKKKVYPQQRMFRHCGMMFEVEKYKIIEGASIKKNAKILVKNSQNSEKNTNYMAKNDITDDVIEIIEGDADEDNKG